MPPFHFVSNMLDNLIKFVMPLAAIWPLPRHKSGRLLHSCSQYIWVCAWEAQMRLCLCTASTQGSACFTSVLHLLLGDKTVLNIDLTTDSAQCLKLANLFWSSAVF